MLQMQIRISMLISRLLNKFNFLFRKFRNISINELFKHFKIKMKKIKF